jgi:hypothetical protein
MSDDRKKKLVPIFEKLGYRPGASISRMGPISSCPDGVYYDFPTAQQYHKWFCLVVVGPMHKTPLEYAEPISDYEVAGVYVLPAKPNLPREIKQLIMERGFFRVDFRPCGDLAEPLASAHPANQIAPDLNLGW